MRKKPPKWKRPLRATKTVIYACGTCAAVQFVTGTKRTMSPGTPWVPCRCGNLAYRVEDN